MLPKKFFVYAHIVPVDIHMLIHSLQHLFFLVFYFAMTLASIACHD